MPRVQNLLTFSEQFDNAAWTKLNCTVSANTTDTVDPLGTNTADKLTDSVDGGAATHRFSQTETAGIVNVTYNSSIYVKAGTKSFFGILTDGGTGAANFDLATQAVTTTGTGILLASIRSIGNGWYRCSVTYIRVTGGFNTLFYLQSTASQTYQGNGTGTVYIWGAQSAICAGLPEYVQTAATVVDTGPVRYRTPNRQNLITYSEQFDNAAWTKTNSTVSANTSDTTDPLGTNTADKIVDTSDGSPQQHRVQNSTETGTFVGQLYTSSIFAKAGTKNFLGIITDGGTGQVSFDLTTGAIVVINATGIVSYGVTTLSNGWFRCWVVYNRVANTVGFVPLFYILNVGSALAYTGAGTGTIYLWGAQDVQCNWMGEYQQTTAVPLNEGPMRNRAVQMQNLILRSAEFDNATWTKADLTVSANSIAAPDGTSTADTLVEAATTAVHQIYQTINPKIEVAVIIFSVYAKYLSRRYLVLYLDNENGSPSQVTFDLQTGVISLAAALGGARITPLANGWYRCALIGNQFNAKYRFAQLALQSTSTVLGTTYAGDGSSGCYVWGAQVNIGNFEGDYAPTTTTVVNPALGTR